MVQRKAGGRCEVKPRGVIVPSCGGKDLTTPGGQAEPTATGGSSSRGSENPAALLQLSLRAGSTPDDTLVSREAIPASQGDTAAGAPGQRAPLERLEAHQQSYQNRGREAPLRKGSRTGRGQYKELYIICIIGRVCPAGTSAGQGTNTKIQAPSSDTVELQITIRLRLA